MKRAIYIFLIIIVLFVVVYFLMQASKPMPAKLGKAETEVQPATSLCMNKITDMLPVHMKAQDNEIVTHTAYTLSYSEKYEQAEWVIYMLTKGRVENKVCKRNDHFIEDEDVASGSATPADYKKSGYDRGHLCPAADMAWSETTMRESFYMSNMSPQVQGFNRGIWKDLEEDVRRWAVENDSLWIVDGPILTNIDQYIGANRVGVPKKYYKLVFDFSQKDGYKAIAFVLPNQSSSANPMDFAITVDSLESLTGLNFFSKLPYNFIKTIECKIDKKAW
jgi:endonuclease G